MRHPASLFVWLLAAGCSVGTPGGFSSGDHWSFPLVGPLEDGVLVTPVTVHGHGPYLFAIDPDANVTAVDKQVVEDAGLRIGVGPRRIDETDTGQIRIYAELLDLQIAGLTIERRDAMVFAPGLYDTEGRHLSGVLGRDAIADSLVFGFDRDQGIATLSTVQAFKPPPGATAIRYKAISSSSVAFVTSVGREQAAGQGDSQIGIPQGSVVPVPRRLVTAQIGRARFAMHLDLGASVSQLAEAKWGRAGLVPADVQLRLVDEAATARDVGRAGVAGEVFVADTRTPQVMFVPYIDRRFGDNLDGALGLDFFRPYAVYASWDSRTYFLKSRGELAATTTARLGRWGAALPACPHPGCITAAIAAGDGGTAIDVARDAEAAGRALEVFIAAAPATGQITAPLVIELPAGADKLTAPVPAEYAGATLAVLDVSPFPRSCPGGGGCVLQVVGAASTRGAPAAPAAPGERGPQPEASAVAAAHSVPLDKLRRLTGEPAIPPSDDARRAAAGKPIAAAIVKICLDPDGKVASTRMVKPSGVPAYDDQLQTTIRSTWTFDADGKLVCTTATFAGR